MQISPGSMPSVWGCCGVIVALLYDRMYRYDRLVASAGWLSSWQLGKLTVTTVCSGRGTKGGSLRPFVLLNMYT